MTDGTAAAIPETGLLNYTTNHGLALACVGKRAVRDVPGAARLPDRGTRRRFSAGAIEGSLAADTCGE